MAAFDCLHCWTKGATRTIVSFRPAYIAAEPEAHRYCRGARLLEASELFAQHKRLDEECAAP